MKPDISKIINFMFVESQLLAMTLTNETILGFNNYQHVYHYHCQKTGGTSVNHAFSELMYNKQEMDSFLKKNMDHPVFGSDDYRQSTIGRQMKMRLNRAKNKTLKSNSYIFSRNTYGIRRGLFSYASSHAPFENVKLPDNTYTFTVLRDPVKRALSRYKMIRELALKPGGLGHYKQKYLEDYIDNPERFFIYLEENEPDLLMHQLYMFSKEFNVNKALDNISKLNRILFTDELKKGIQHLSADLNVKLNIYHSKKSGIDINIDKNLESFLQEKLAREIEFYTLVCSYNN